MKNKDNKKLGSTRHLNLRLEKSYQFESGITIPEALRRSRNIIEYYSMVIRLDKKFNNSFSN